MAYALKWNQRLVAFRYYGTVTDDDFLHSNVEAYGDPRFADLRWQVVLFDPDIRLLASGESVERIAKLDHDAYKANPAIQVVLVGDGQLQQRIYEIYADHAAEDGWEIIAFETLEEASVHVGRSLPALMPTR